jgi:hypothetical protein
MLFVRRNLSTKNAADGSGRCQNAGRIDSIVQEALRMPQDLVELFAAVERLEQVLRTNARKLDELGKKVDRIDHEVSSLAADVRSLRR